MSTARTTTPADDLATWEAATLTERKLVMARLARRDAAAIWARDPFLHTTEGREAAYSVEILDASIERLTARAIWEAGRP